MHASLIVSFLAVFGVLLPTVAALRATCVLQPNPGSIVSGTIVLTQQTPTDLVYIDGIVRGLPRAGPHAMHIHEYGNLIGGCEAAGEHFNPLNMLHGGPISQMRHVGDFGNIAADVTGQAPVRIVDHVTQLYGSLSAIGRSIVVHDGVDDLGQNFDLESKKSGNSGGRLACCTIIQTPDARIF